MYFQTLDDKGECVGVYKNGELHFNNLPEGMERTWKYAEYLEIKELAKEDMGIEKYRKSENRRQQGWG